MAVRNNYTFSDFYNLIRNKINEFSEKKPTYWGNGSIARAISQSVAYFTQYLQLQINIMYSSFRLKTAKGIHLDNRAADFNSFRKGNTNAVAIEAFVGTTGRIININIPAGTICSTSNDLFGNRVDYTLNDNIILSSGAIFTTGLITCTKAGIIGNNVSGSVNVLQNNIVGIASIFNIEDIGNGTEDETDDQFKARISNDINSLEKATEFAIKSAIYKVEGVTFVDVKENSPAAGNFSVYVTTESGIVDSITRAKITNAVRSVKAFGITFTTIVPITYNVSISLDISIDASNYQEVALSDLIKITLQEFINTKKISELNISDINFIVRKINGVNNVKNILINSVNDDLILSEIYTIKVADISNITINFL